MLKDRLNIPIFPGDIVLTTNNADLRFAVVLNETPPAAWVQPQNKELYGRMRVAYMGYAWQNNPAPKKTKTVVSPYSNTLKINLNQCYGVIPPDHIAFLARESQEALVKHERKLAKEAAKNVAAKKTDTGQLPQ